MLVAPKHPAAPETAVKIAAVSLFSTLHAEIKAECLRHAPMLRRVRSDDSPLAASVADALHYRARYLVDEVLAVPVMRAADATAGSVKQQTERATGVVPTVDLEPAAAEYASFVLNRVQEDFDETVDCSIEQLNLWAEDGDLDEDDLDKMLEACGARHRGKMVAWLFLAFGFVFGKMVRLVQVSAGVDEAVWITKRDEKVRPAHRRLDGKAFSWGGEPPLSAAESTSGEPCFPGDDFGCRCTAAVVTSPAR